MKPSKQAMHDDIFLSIILIVAGISGLSGEHPYGSGFAILFGALWLAIRLFHLTHQDEVFGNDN